MKKIWQLWFRINGREKYLLLLLLDAGVVLGSIGWLHGIILSFLAEIGVIRNAIYYFLYLMVLGMIMTSIFSLTVRDVRSRYCLAQWLGMTKLQQFIYELINIQVFGSVGLGLMFAFADFGKVSIVGALFLYLAVYLTTVYFAVVHAVNLDETRRYKNKRQGVISVNNAQCEIVFFEIVEKVRCIDSTLVLVLVLFMDIFIVCVLKTNHWMLQLIVMQLVFLSTDKTFENHCKSAEYLAAINVSVKKYIWLQIISTTLYNCSGVFLIALFYSNPKEVMICWTMEVCLSVFWTITFEYLELVAHVSVANRIFFELANLVLGCIPFLNIFVLYQRYRRIKERWQNDST